MFFKKWKEDKRFKQNVIIIGAILLLLSSISSVPVTTQSTWPPESACSDLNTQQYIDKIFMPDAETAVYCGMREGCRIEVFPMSWLDPLKTVKKCVAGVPDNHYTYGGDASCKSGFSANLDTSSKLAYCADILGDCYKCLPSKGLVTCSGWQQPFADIFSSFWKSSGIGSCNTKAYIVIGAVGLLFVALI